jgi:hypothetical protein
VKLCLKKTKKKPKKPFEQLEKKLRIQGTLQIAEHKTLHNAQKGQG